MSERCANDTWINDLRHVRDYGTVVCPRGQETREIVGFQSQPIDMRFPIVTSPARRLGYRFMAAEAAWILSGDDRVSTIAPFSKEISKFSDDGVRFFGAYGIKVLEQLPYIVSTLLADLDTRQAVLNIWRESPGPSRDIPCTLSTQFLVRDGRLHCVDTMRSSDLWLGHPYDVFNFSMLSLMIVVELRSLGHEIGLGSLYLNAGSKHIYERNYDGVQAVLENAEGHQDTGPLVDPDRFMQPADVVEHLWDLAKSGRAMEQQPWGV